MVIVIGATGFIGMYTVEKLLAEGKEVLATGRNKKMLEVLSNMGAKTIHMDISNIEDIKKLPIMNVDGVLLLAGLLPANVKLDIEKDENADEYFKINVIGMINILEYCRKNGISKLINCCSYSDIAKSWKEGVALKESEPRNFNYTGDHSVYVISKNAANDVMEYYNQQHGMQCASFRFPPVYGVGPHGNIYVNGKLYKSGIQTFIEKAENGENIEIWGDSHIKRDIIYVKDVARAFSMALDSDNTYGLYNMTSGTELDLEEQVKSVIKVFGDENKTKIIYRTDKANNTPSFLFDMSKAKEDFGFEPEYTDYEKMMIDYKKEMKSDKWKELVKSREKN